MFRVSVRIRVFGHYLTRFFETEAAAIAWQSQPRFEPWGGVTQGELKMTDDGLAFVFVRDGVEVSQPVAL